MTITTHIAASCLITVFTLSSGLGLTEKVLILTVGSSLLHFALDLFPHGFIATPVTIFKKPIPTIVELFPGPLILFLTITVFGHAIWFLVASGFGLIPDILTTFLLRFERLAEKVPLLTFFHKLHRKVHWFETDMPDGKIILHLPNYPLLAVEGVIMTGIVVTLFNQPPF
ncbi:MAG: hypothetical protein ABIK28_11160 [Planctomycetota bacterium]